MEQSGTDTLRSVEPAEPQTRQEKARTQRRAQVDAELVRLVYAQAPLGITTSLVVAALVAFAHWDVVETSLIVGWFIGHVLVNVFRLLLIQAYGSDLRAKAKPQTWGNWYTLTSAGSGVAWGSTALLTALSQSPSHQYFVAFVVGGMVSGGLAVLSPLTRAYVVFSVLALLPVALWFLLQGDQIYFLMGLLGILLLAVMLLTARRLNASLTRSLDLSFANAELANTVSAACDETVRINRELEREVAARRRIEAWLKREKERAQTTLQSLGDAVITTDAGCRIDFVNPAAEQLTGWSLADAHDRPLEEVFRLHGKADRRDGRADPVRHCLSEAVTQGFGDGILERKDKVRISVQHSWAPIQDSVGELSGSVLVFRASSEQSTAVGTFATEDSADSLTGLLDRPSFERRLLRAAATAESAGIEHVVLRVRVDECDTVRDLHGKQAGDELLRSLAGLLRGQFRETDSVARLSNSEFGILLEHCPVEGAQPVVEKVDLAIAGFRFPWAGQELALTPELEVKALRARAELESLPLP